MSLLQGKDRSPPRLLRGYIALALAVAGLIAGTSARAQTFQFTETVGGYTYSANASFHVVGNDLHVTLTNLGDPVSVNGQVLTGLFWNGATTSYGTGAVTLTGGSEIVNNPPISSYTGSDTPDNHWKYTNAGLPGGYTQGIGSVGFDVFSPPDTFSGKKTTFNATTWGLVNEQATGGVKGKKTPFIDNSLSFVLTGVTDPLAPITQVRFQYGTSLTEQSFDVPVSLVPEPSGLMLFLPGLLSLGLLRRRRSD